jgi:CheY-like chemotaxis protein
MTTSTDNSLNSIKVAPYTLLHIFNNTFNLLKLKASKISVKKNGFKPNLDKENTFKIIEKKDDEKEVNINLKKDIATSLKGKKILVVDDNIINRMVANIILKDYDVLVSEAGDGQEAVNYLKNNSCDLVLMDLQMPVLNGYLASEIIRTELKLNLPIIAVTASDLKEEEEKCFNAGMNDFLFKPFNREQLLQVICSWVTT